MSKNYGYPSKGDPNSGTSTVQDVAFVQNAETVLYNRYNGFYGNENGFDLGTLQSTNAK